MYRLFAGDNRIAAHQTVAAYSLARNILEIVIVISCFIKSPDICSSSPDLCYAQWCHAAAVIPPPAANVHIEATHNVAKAKSAQS